MQFRGELVRTVALIGGGIEVTLSIANNQSGIELLNGDLDIEIKPHKEKRSLNANAYFHKLCAEIAKVQQSSLEEVKRDMVVDYGTIATDANGDKIFIRLPKTVNISDYFPYAKWIGDSKDTKRPCSDYIVFKETHTLNTSEMARLIDGVVSEAKILGIETKTSEQIEQLKSLWRE